jgi:lysophospholipase L1-like esterase
MKTILFQGDSITDALRSRENDEYKGSGYAALVSGKLGFDNPGEYQFLNRGISGNRVVDLYARIKADILNLKPDYLSILIGVNDVWHEFSSQNGVDTEKYAKVYGLLIEEILEGLPDIKILILEPFALKGTSTEAVWGKFYPQVRERAAKSKLIAEKFGLAFIPLQEKFDAACKLAPESYWIYDGVHPTVSGHELITREWIKAFNTLK